MDKQAILDGLKEAVVMMRSEEAETLALKSLEDKVPANEAIFDGLVKGMEIVGEKFEKKEYFVPEVLCCAKAFNTGLDVLRPHVETDRSKHMARIVIGVVEGDVHDIGKNIVRIMLETSGHEMHDLGNNVELDRFVETVAEVNADILALSTLMSTTMDGMSWIIHLLEKAGLRKKVKVIVGGAPISAKFAQDIGADGYAKDASEAVRLVKTLLAEVKQ